MIPTVQFDPATLAIWTTTGSLTERDATITGAAMRFAAQGIDIREIVEAIPEDDPLRRRVLWLVSAVWHEKRHFLDTCLTNYGARRFRDLFNLAANFMPLAAHAQERDEPMWMPIEVYGDPVQRAILGISEPAPNVLEIARIAKQMKRLMADLEQPFVHGPDSLYLGGEAQMEGLAQACQLNSVEYDFGVEGLVAVTTEYVHRLPRGGPYRAIETVASALGCTSRTPKGVTTVNIGLPAALFFTSLCGRFYGLGQLPPSEMVSPMERLTRMVDALGPKPGRFEMTDEESAELVDRVARQLWGRTAFEEAEADIDGMEAHFNPGDAPWLVDEGLDKVFADFVALRRRLLKAAKETGLAGVLPRSFPALWRDQLQPWHVVATPGGSPEDGEGDTILAVHLNLPPELKQIFPSSVTLARVNGSDSEAEFALQTRDAWLQMLERHGPRALLMLNGRQHRRMVPVELDRPLNDLREIGIEIRFHPKFEWPSQRSSETCTAEAIALGEFTGRDTFVCDLTGETIDAVDAAVMTPWEFRRSPLVGQFKQSAGIIAEAKLLTDWSDWIVSRNLLD